MEVKRRTVRSLVTRLSSDSDQIQNETICELRLLSKHDPESRLLIAEVGAIPLLSQSLFNPDPKIQENAIATLLNLSISNREILMSTRGLVDAVAYVLRCGSSPTSVQAAAATVYSLLVVDDYRPIIGSKKSILAPLIDIIQNPNSPTRSIKDALKALFGVSLYPLNRPRLVELGLVPALFSLAVTNSSVGVVEDATAVIAQVAGCYESIDAFRKVSGVEALSDLLDAATGSSMRVRENAVSALLNMAQCGGEKVAQDIQGMGSAAFSGLMQMAETGSSRAKDKANALLNTLMAVGYGDGYGDGDHQGFDISNSFPSSSS